MPSMPQFPQPNDSQNDITTVTAFQNKNTEALDKGKTQLNEVATKLKDGTTGAVASSTENFINTYLKDSGGDESFESRLAGHLKDEENKLIDKLKHIELKTFNAHKPSEDRIHLKQQQLAFERYQRRMNALYLNELNRLKAQAAMSGIPDDKIEAMETKLNETYEKTLNDHSNKFSSSLDSKLRKRMTRARQIYRLPKDQRPDGEICTPTGNMPERDSDFLDATEEEIDGATVRYTEAGIQVDMPNGWGRGKRDKWYKKNMPDILIRRGKESVNPSGISPKKVRQAIIKGINKFNDNYADKKSGIKPITLGKKPELKLPTREDYELKDNTLQREVNAIEQQIAEIIAAGKKQKGGLTDAQKRQIKVLERQKDLATLKALKKDDNPPENIDQQIENCKKEMQLDQIKQRKAENNGEYQDGDEALHAKLSTETVKDRLQADLTALNAAIEKQDGNARPEQTARKHLLEAQITLENIKLEISQAQGEPSAELLAKKAHAEALVNVYQQRYLIAKKGRHATEAMQHKEQQLIAKFNIAKLDYDIAKRGTPATDKESALKTALNNLAQGYERAAAHGRVQPTEQAQLDLLQAKVDLAKHQNEMGAGDAATNEQRAKENQLKTIVDLKALELGILDRSIPDGAKTQEQKQALQKLVQAYADKEAAGNNDQAMAIANKKIDMYQARIALCKNYRELGNAATPAQRRQQEIDEVAIYKLEAELDKLQGHGGQYTSKRVDNLTAISTNLSRQKELRDAQAAAENGVLPPSEAAELNSLEQQHNLLVLKNKLLASIIENGPAHGQHSARTNLLTSVDELLALIESNKAIKIRGAEASATERTASKLNDVKIEYKLLQQKIALRQLNGGKAATTEEKAKLSTLQAKIAKQQWIVDKHPTGALPDAQSTGGKLLATHDAYIELCQEIEANRNNPGVANSLQKSQKHLLKCKMALYEHQLTIGDADPNPQQAAKTELLQTKIALAQLDVDVLSGNKANSQSAIKLQSQYQELIALQTIKANGGELSDEQNAQLTLVKAQIALSIKTLEIESLPPGTNPSDIQLLEQKLLKVDAQMRKNHNDNDGARNQRPIAIQNILSSGDKLKASLQAEISLLKEIAAVNGEPSAAQKAQKTYYRWANPANEAIYDLRVELANNTRLNESQKQARTDLINNIKSLITLCEQRRDLQLGNDASTDKVKAQIELLDKQIARDNYKIKVARRKLKGTEFNENVKQAHDDYLQTQVDLAQLDHDILNVADHPGAEDDNVKALRKALESKSARLLIIRDSYSGRKDNRADKVLNLDDAKIAALRHKIKVAINKRAINNYEESDTAQKDSAKTSELDYRLKYAKLEYEVATRQAARGVEAGKATAAEKDLHNAYGKLADIYKAIADSDNGEPTEGQTQAIELYKELITVHGEVGAAGPTEAQHHQIEQLRAQIKVTEQTVINNNDGEAPSKLNMAKLEMFEHRLKAAELQREIFQHNEQNQPADRNQALLDAKQQLNDTHLELAALYQEIINNPGNKAGTPSPIQAAQLAALQAKLALHKYQHDEDNFNNTNTDAYKVNSGHLDAKYQKAQHNYTIKSNYNDLSNADTAVQILYDDLIAVYEKPANVNAENNENQAPGLVDDHTPALEAKVELLKAQIALQRNAVVLGRIEKNAPNHHSRAGHEANMPLRAQTLERCAFVNNIYNDIANNEVNRLDDKTHHEQQIINRHEDIEAIYQGVITQIKTRDDNGNPLRTDYQLTAQEERQVEQLQNQIEIHSIKNQCGLAADVPTANKVPRNALPAADKARVALLKHKNSILDREIAGNNITAAQQSLLTLLEQQVALFELAEHDDYQAFLTGGGDVALDNAEKLHSLLDELTYIKHELTDAETNLADEDNNKATYLAQVAKLDNYLLKALKQYSSNLDAKYADADNLTARQKQNRVSQYSTLMKNLVTIKANINDHGDDYPNKDTNLAAVNAQLKTVCKALTTFYNDRFIELAAQQSNDNPPQNTAPMDDVHNLVKDIIELRETINAHNNDFNGVINTNTNDTLEKAAIELYAEKVSQKNEEINQNIASNNQGRLARQFNELKTIHNNLFKYAEGYGGNGFTPKTDAIKNTLAANHQTLQTVIGHQLDNVDLNGNLTEQLKTVTKAISALEQANTDDVVADDDKLENARLLAKAYKQQVMIVNRQLGAHGIIEKNALAKLEMLALKAKINYLQEQIKSSNDIDTLSDISLQLMTAIENLSLCKQRFDDSNPQLVHPQTKENTADDVIENQGITKPDTANNIQASAQTSYLNAHQAALDKIYANLNAGDAAIANENKAELLTSINQGNIYLISVDKLIANDTDNTLNQDALKQQKKQIIMQQLVRLENLAGKDDLSRQEVTEAKQLSDTLKSYVEEWGEADFNAVDLADDNYNKNIALQRLHENAVKLDKAIEAYNVLAADRPSNNNIDTINTKLAEVELLLNSDFIKTQTGDSGLQAQLQAHKQCLTQLQKNAQLLARLNPLKEQRNNHPSVTAYLTKAEGWINAVTTALCDKSKDSDRDLQDNKIPARQTDIEARIKLAEDIQREINHYNNSDNTDYLSDANDFEKMLSGVTEHAAHTQRLLTLVDARIDVLKGKLGNDAAVAADPEGQLLLQQKSALEIQKNSLEKQQTALTALQTGLNGGNAGAGKFADTEHDDAKNCTKRYLQIIQGTAKNSGNLNASIQTDIDCLQTFIDSQEISDGYKSYLTGLKTELESLESSYKIKQGRPPNNGFACRQPNNASEAVPVPSINAI